MASAEQIKDLEEDISLRGFRSLYESLKQAEDLEAAQLYGAAIAYKFANEISIYTDPEKIKRAQDKMNDLSAFGGLSNAFEGIQEYTKAMTEGIGSYSKASASLEVGMQTFLESFTEENEIKQDVGRRLGLESIMGGIGHFFEDIKVESPKQSFWKRLGF